jgi:dTMP kinase
MDERGFFISFEGSEGSGKTTQISRIAERFEKEGFEVVVTREPGGTEIGESIRHLLKHDVSASLMFPETELLLFAAARAQLVREVIIPALDAGKIILSDRFLDSTTVYQGVARQISSEPIQAINNFAAGDLMPDLTVVLDIPTDIGLKRIKHRATDLPDRMEEESVEFYEQVRKGYLLLADSLPERFVVVNGAEERDIVEQHIWDELRFRFS